MATIEKMATNGTPARKLETVQIILSALWAARTLSSLQGDTMRLSDPVMLNELVAEPANNLVTTEVLLAFSPFLVIPIFMSVLSLMLSSKANRWANLIMGAFFIVWDLTFMFLLYVNSAGYEVFWGIAYLLFASLIVWYAWTWPKRGNLSTT